MINSSANVYPNRVQQRAPRALQALSEVEMEMERLLSQNQIDWSNGEGDMDFSPQCCIRENGKAYYLQLDIPGIKKSDIKIEVERFRLTVSGERKEQVEKQQNRKFLSEMHHGFFMRTFNLPTGVDENKVDAHCEDGVLTIKAAKLEASKTKEIKIH